jgi:hypothetical protein
MLKLGRLVNRANSLVLAVLLVGGMLWGQCASCPLILPAQAAAHHDCCGGQCNMPHPKQQHEKQCPSQAAAPQPYHKAPGSPALSISTQPAIVAGPAPAPVEAPADPAHIGSVHTYSPPDIYLLNSVIRA